MEDYKVDFDSLLKLLYVINEELNNARKTSNDKVALLKELCYSDIDFLREVKQIFLDINMLRWEDFSRYCDLVAYTPATHLVERTVTGIMMEEAINKN